MCFKRISLLIVIAVFNVACSSSNTIRQVTALPNQPISDSADEFIAPPTNPTSNTPVPSNNNQPLLGSEPDNFALATFTPSANRYPPGEARAIALATDTVMQPEIDQPLTFNEAIVSIRFDEMYDGFNPETGLQFSDKLKSLDGQRVLMEGYVAPPLKPRIDFFVLTRLQLPFCPFCSANVDWPDDIVLVYLPYELSLSSEVPVQVLGILEVGSNIDPETGMVSLVRIYLEEWSQLR